MRLPEEGWPLFVEGELTFRPRNPVREGGEIFRSERLRASGEEGQSGDPPLPGLAVVVESAPLELEGVADRLAAVLEARADDRVEDRLVREPVGWVPPHETHDRGVDARLRMEGGTRDPLEDLTAGAVRDAHRQAGVVLRPRLRNDSVRELPLEHEDRAIKHLVEELERHGGRDAVRKVRDHHVERGPFDSYCVPADDLDPRADPRQRLGEPAVLLDRDDPSRAVREDPGEDSDA